MLGMAVVADPLVRAVLGTQWIPVIRLFQILAPVGLIQSIQTTIGHIFVAKGRTDWMFRWSLASTAVLVICFLVGARFGVTGVAFAYAIAYFGILMYPMFLIPFRLIDLSLREFARSLWPQLAISLAMAAICAAWLQGLMLAGILNPWGQLISTALIGTLVYVYLMVKIRPAVIRHLEDAVGGPASGPLGNCLAAIGLFPESAAT
jgi:PST family polysaccharide transporter